MTDNNTHLRFAPLIRVSTEQQERKGESLRTQADQIQKAVERLGGIIPEGLKTRYAGQEHATPDFERKKLAQLLEDASKDLFDAVIVADTSRWSRDNATSKEGLEVLRKNNIRFFDTSTEWDLWKPEAILFLGMSAEIGEFQARTQSLKSIQNRIARAKQGKPASGKLPFGRTWDKATQTWGIDPAKKAFMEDVARRYLDGESIPALAKSVGMNHTTLWKNLKYRCGEEWEVSFKAPNLNIDETVVIKVPRLLDDETIEKIHQRSDLNKTTHMPNSAQYLLSKFIFCSRCGYAMFGQVNQRRASRTHYYRHPRHERASVNARQCSFHSYVRADEIEKAVFVHLYEMFSDPERIAASFKKAVVPKDSEITKLDKERAELQKEVNKINEGNKRLLDGVRDGHLPAHLVMPDVEKHEARKLPLVDRISEIDNLLAMANGHPLRKIRIDPEKIKASAAFRNRWTPKAFLELSYEEKRELLEEVFRGTDDEGNPLGVYVDHDDNKNLSFTIRGRLIYGQGVQTVKKSLGLTNEELIAAMMLEDEQLSGKEFRELMEAVAAFSYRSPAPAPRGCRSPAGNPLLLP